MTNFGMRKSWLEKFWEIIQDCDSFFIGRILLHKNSTKNPIEMYVQYLQPAILKYHVF